MRVTFSNDPAYFWTGRAYITDFDRSREVGQFHLSIPKAEPYKYSLADSTEDWLWDPFDFETGVIDQEPELQFPALDHTQYAPEILQ